METTIGVNIVVLWIVSLVNVLLTIGLARRLNSAFPKRETLKVGGAAPDFVAHRLDGGEARRADFASKRVVLAFLSPHCEPCREQAVQVNSLRETAVNYGTEIVMVSDADSDVTRRFIAELDLSVPVLLGLKEFFDAYKAMNTPAYCLVDEEGRIRATSSGFYSFKRELEAYWGRGDTDAGT